MNIHLSAGPGIISQCGSKGLASCMRRPAPVCHGQNVTVSPACGPELGHLLRVGYNGGGGEKRSEWGFPHKD